MGFGRHGTWEATSPVEEGEKRAVAAAAAQGEAAAAARHSAMCLYV